MFGIVILLGTLSNAVTGNFGLKMLIHEPDKAHTNRNRLAELINILSLPTSAADYYGSIRSTLEKAGTPTGANDLWIAAHALSEGLILVSNNRREFQRVPGLIVDNWIG